MPYPLKSTRLCHAMPGGLMLAVSLLGLADAALAMGPAAAHVRPMQAAPITPVAVFDTDRRTLLDTARKPLAAFIGTLRSGAGGPLCTAFCLKPDVIATASHCLFGTSASKGPDLDHIEFSTADTPGTSSPIAGRGIGLASHNIASGTRALSIAPPIDAANDWAIARLAKPVCRSGGLALRNPADPPLSPESNDLYQVAMHRDLPDTELRADGPCPLVKDMPDARADLIARDFTNVDAILFHRCDTGPGSSGSPMLVAGKTGWEVAGINIGTYVISHAVVEARAGDAASRSTPIANTAIAAAHFAAAFQRFEKNDLVETQEEIASLAVALKKRGYYRHRIPQRMTPQLQRAIFRYEASAGLTATGQPTRSLLAVLNGQTSAQVPVQAPAQTSVQNSVQATGSLPTFDTSARALRRANLPR